MITGSNRNIIIFEEERVWLGSLDGMKSGLCGVLPGLDWIELEADRIKIVFCIELHYHHHGLAINGAKF